MYPFLAIVKFGELRVDQQFPWCAVETCHSKLGETQPNSRPQNQQSFKPGVPEETRPF